MVARLRRETRLLHARLEQGSVGRSLLSPAIDLATLRDALARLYGFHAPVERRLGPALGPLAAEFALPSRCRAPLLASDLGRLGVPPDRLARVPRCRPLPVLASPAHALGCLWVLEGSRLGGQVVVSRLAARLPIDARDGASYFHGYGAATRRQWDAFCSALETEAARAPDADQVVAGAVATFERLAEWLA